MRILRSILALAAISASIVAAHELCWVRYRCAREAKAADGQVTRAQETQGYEREQLGRAAMARLIRCLEHDPADYQARVLYGIAAEAAGQKALALEMYDAALRLNERPEIYSNIGVLQLESGQLEKARQNLMRAAMFNTTYTATVSQPMRDELIEAVNARRKRLNERAEQMKR